VYDRNQPERFPLGVPFNRSTVGFAGPEPLVDACTTSFPSTSALRRRHNQLPTAIAVTMPPIVTAGKKIVWTNQMRRWTFATRIDA
jgi:hypothetical protein